jgi:hypothetical protein
VKKSGNRINILSYIIFMSQPKDVYVFVPPRTDRNNTIVQRLSSQFPPLETNTFESFYNRRIRQYSAKPPKCFCNGLETLLDFAGDTVNHVTLVSMDDTHVYAVAIVNVKPRQKGKKKEVDMYIEILCGNKALPKTGEGSRLLKILEDIGFETGNHKIHLDSAPDAVNFYKDRSYHVLPTNTPGLDLIPMSKDTKALSRWQTIKTNLKFSAKTQRHLDAKYAEMRSSRAKGKSRKNKKSRKSHKKSRKSHKKSRKSHKRS